MDTPLNISNFFPKPLNICFAAAAVAFKFKFCVNGVDNGVGVGVDTDGCIGEGGLSLLLLSLRFAGLSVTVVVVVVVVVSVTRPGDDGGGVGGLGNGVVSALWLLLLLLLESWKLPMKELTVVAMPAGFIAPMLTKDPGALIIGSRKLEITMVYMYVYFNEWRSNRVLVRLGLDTYVFSKYVCMYVFSMYVQYVCIL